MTLAGLLGTGKTTKKSKKERKPERAFAELLTK